MILKEKFVRFGDRKFKLDIVVFELYIYKLNDVVEYWIVFGIYLFVWEFIKCFYYVFCFSGFYDFLFY